jgi:signal peptidase I
MSPTLKDGEIYILQKGRSDLKRQDIIAFYSSKDELNYVKRIVGLPGETIEIKNNQVYINGQQLKESYVVRNKDIPDFGPIKISPYQVFVLGDNRAISEDSRVMGTIPIVFIKGKIIGY